MEHATSAMVKPIMMTVRIGGRRMTLTWRPRKRMPSLLRALLGRSLRALAGVLLGSLSTSAMAQISSSALPTGGQVVAGQALISQLSNQMRVSQSTDKAIINWNTFNIGSAARVDFQMPTSTSAVLNRVITNDPSSLLGTLTSNGRIWLINPAGIMVGAGATIDVAGFIGSTLNIRNEDFLAERLNFSGSGAGIANFGRITTPQGGNVYLVGSSVENHGLINTPEGEILLAAGQTVEIADTGTPGVKVAITGTQGSVSNVGQVLAEAGRVGLAGVLVRNAGSISATSVVKEGGRIFLRASKSVTTEATSVIEASGTSGGDIRLVAEGMAAVDGKLVARGSVGRGGFVETSGKEAFSILRAPDVGPGGQWLIDPKNISVRAADRATNTSDGSTDTSVVTTELLQEALNAGTNVDIMTTAELGADDGDIVVYDAIVKSAGGEATLTLNAQRNITMQQAITATSGKLNVALSHAGTAALSNSIALNGGKLTSVGQLILSGATLDNVMLDTSGKGASASIVTGATTSLVGGTTWNNIGQVDFQSTGNLHIAAGASFSNLVGGTVNLSGTADKVVGATGGMVSNAGAINKFGPGFTAIDNLTNTGIVNVQLGTLGLTGNGSYGGSFNLLSGTGTNAATVLSIKPGDAQTAVLSGTITTTSSEGVPKPHVDFSGGEGSTTYINSDLTLDHATLASGALSGTGKLAVTDFAWSGGAIKGNAGDPAWNFDRLHLTGFTALQGRTLNLGPGSNSVADGATLFMSSGARLNNSGVLTLSNGSFLGYPVAGGGNSEINNAGTILSVGDGAQPRVNAMGGVQEAGVSTTRFNNLAGATVRVQDSTLELGPGTHNGNLQLNATGVADTKLTFYHYGGVIDLNAGTTISEARSNGGLTGVQFGNPKSTQSGEVAGMTRINVDLTLDNAALGSGTLAGSGSFTATNFAWKGGTISGFSTDPAFNVTNLSSIGTLALEGRRLNLLAGGSGTAAALTTLNINESAVLNSDGNVALGAVVNAGTVNVSGGQLATASVQNAGRIRLANGTTLAATDGLLNLESGSLAGSGTVNTGQYYLVNSGSIGAGNSENFGTLSIQGNLQQTATGVTNIKIGSGGQFDRVSVSGNVLLDGRLAVSMQDASMPAVGDSLTFLTMGGARTGSFAVTGVPTGVQAGYGLFAGEAARLTMLPSTVTRYFNNAGGGFNWSNAANWSGSLLPGASDDVWIHAGSTVSHAAGVDSISKLALIGATPLSVGGGSLTVSGATTIDGTLAVSGSGTYTANGAVGGSGTLQVAGGSAVLNGASSLPTLAISSGTVSGAGSLAVTRSFSQTGGALNMPGTVTLTQQSGALSVGNIIAGDLKLIASASAIRQTAGLSATSLQTSSVGGTLLTNSGNRISNFKAANSGTGSIALVNVSSPSSLVLHGISNTATGGNISVDNTGGIIDNAPIVAASGGAVSLVARSPLVVNAPISAGSNVILQAMSSTGGNDNLTINSSVTSTTGSLQLSAGSTLSVSSTGSLSVTGGAIGLTSLSGTVSIADPTTITGAIPTITAPAPIAQPATTATTETVLTATTTIVDSTNKTSAQSSTQSSTTADDSVTGSFAPTVSTTTGSSNTFTLAGDQTVGGTTGTFGGSSVASLGDTGGSGSFAGSASTASNPGTDSASANSSPSSPSSNTASSSSSSSSSSAESSASSTSDSSGSGDKQDQKKDEKSAKQDKSDKPEKKSQAASKSVKKSLPVCT